MPGENLTHGEALDRANNITVDSYAVELDLASEKKRFDSKTTITFNAKPGSSTFLDLVDAKVSAITLNGESVNPKRAYRDSRIHLAGLQAQNVVVVEARCRYSNTGEGMHRFVDPADGEVYLYTQFEVPDARRVFATFEQPDLKATFQLTVTAPADWQVVGNQPTPAGAKIAGRTRNDISRRDRNDMSRPDRKDDDGVGEVAVWRFGATPRMSTYLVALVAGPYARWDSELTSTDGRTTPLGVFARKSLAEHVDADYIFDITRKGFEFFENQFDYPYPFDKYDQLFVPEFNAGAMENVGCVTIADSLIFRGKVTDALRERRVITILHELAHMWFGDLVTMKWWNDLWLNESFAEFVSTLATAEATEWRDAWATFCASEKTWAYQQDALPSTHPIVAPVADLEDVYTNFDGITYAKGASVLKQLAVYVGRDNFMKALHNYFHRYAYQNATLADLLAELERASGKPVMVWAQQWLQTAGTNTLSLDLRCDANGVIEQADIIQTSPPDHQVLRPQRLAIGLYNGHEKDGAVVVERDAQITVDIEGERTPISELIGQKRPDLILLNDDDLTFAKIRLDRQSMQYALEHLGEIRDPLARGLIWAAAWDEVADAEQPVGGYFEAALAHLGHETNSTTAAEVLYNLNTAAHTFIPEPSRHATVARLADNLWLMAQHAAPDSDLQLQFVRNFADHASTAGQAKTIRALLDGETKLDGLVIDTDLRWDLLRGLAQNNQLTEADVEQALKADNTATGHQAAARVRAAVNTPEAKAEALDNLINNRDVPNAVIRAASSGFSRSNQPEVLAPLLPKYIDALNHIWDTRTYQMADELISGLYPRRLANETLRAAVQQWLDQNPGAAPALRRLVIEELADTERALKAQSLAETTTPRA